MTLHIWKMKLLYTPNFMFVDASVIEFREFNRKIIWDHFQATVKLTLQDNFDLFIDIFQHVLHFDVGRSEIEWNTKVIMKISVFT